MTNLGYERVTNDFYPTPAWCTEALIPELPVDQFTTVWEPACGPGGMSEVLAKYYSVASTDLVDYGFGETGVNFLDATEARAPGIITNPPYHLAEEFLRHAIKLTKPVEGCVAMLLRNEYDSAKTRRDIFAQAPFAKKLVLTKRPMWFAEKKASPRHNYSWFIFNWRHQGPPVITYSR